RGRNVTGVQTCALPIWPERARVVGVGERPADHDARPRREARERVVGARTAAVPLTPPGTRSVVGAVAALERRLGDAVAADGRGEIGRAACRERGEPTGG